MAENNFYCSFCDRTFSLKNEYEQHCQGKKHISNQRRFRCQEAASRKLYVRGIDGIKDVKILETYFGNFGKVEDILCSGKPGSSYAVVEFNKPECVTRALKVKHKISGGFLFVKRFEYRPSPWEDKQYIHQQLEEDEKAKQTETMKHMRELLMSADNVVDQISVVAESLKLGSDDLKARIQICDKLTSMFTHHFGNCKIYQFGSSINGFGAKGCDLDLFLDMNSQDLPNSGIKKVKKLAEILSKSSCFTKILTIPSSRCPVVRFVHKSSNIKCDLSINNRKALHNSYLLKLYSSDPRVHKLVSIVRMWARSKGLAGGSGTTQLFTSYSISLIVLYFIMHRHPKIIPLVDEVEKAVEGASWEVVDDWRCLNVPLNAKLPPLDNRDTEVDLVKDFFTFYSSSINWDTDALVMKDATVIQRSSISLDPSYIGCKVGCMTVLDPFVLTHNVVANINEKTKVKFVAEIKRAAELISDWPALVQRSRSNPWGIAALLVPSPEEAMEVPFKKGRKRRNKNLATGADQKENPVQVAKNTTARVEGEQDNGEFCIIVRPLPKTMSSDKLQLIAKQNNVRPAEQWCILAQELILKVLRTVFLVEVEEGGERIVEEEEKIELVPDIHIPTLAGEVCQGSSNDIGNLSEDKNLECDVNGVSSEGKITGGARNKVDKRKDGVQDASCGKRSSDTAHLDRNGAELAEDSRKDQCFSPGSPYKNPNKKFCEGVDIKSDQSNLVASNACDGSLLETMQCKEHDCSSVASSPLGQDYQVLSSESMDNVQEGYSNAESLPGSSRSYSPVKTDNTSSTITGSPTHSGTLSAIKTFKIVSYRCRCKHQLWIGRKKLFSQLPNQNSFIGLALEQEITNLALRKPKVLQTDQTQCHKNQAKYSSGKSTSEQKGVSQMASSKSEQTKNENETQGNKAGQGTEPKAEPKTIQKSPCETQASDVEFTCEMLHQNCGSSFAVPHLLLKLRPTNTSSSQFKNFYCSFRSLALHLVMEHFQDVYN